jgi:hypothetical protein
VLTSLSLYIFTILKCIYNIKMKLELFQHCGISCFHYIYAWKFMWTLRNCHNKKLMNYLPPVVCMRVMSYLHYLCLFVHSGVEYILCCVFALFFFVLYIANFSGLSILDFLLRYSLTLFYNYLTDVDRQESAIWWHSYNNGPAKWSTTRVLSNGRPTTIPRWICVEGS